MLAAGQRQSKHPAFGAAAERSVDEHLEGIVVGPYLERLHRRSTLGIEDEASSVVFGMPREAIRLGAAQKILPLDQMAGCIERYASDVALTGVSA